MQKNTYRTYTHISSKHKLFDLKLDEVWQYRELVILFTRRNFKVVYKQTIIGPLWLFINPLLTSLMHMIVFGNIAKLGTDGVPQFLFYIAGNAIWVFFQQCVEKNASTFTSNAGLFGKVYFPRLTIPISNVCSTAIRFFIQMILVIGLIIYYCIRQIMIVHIERWFLLPFVLLWLGVMGMGCGLIMSSLTTKYRDLSVLVGFGMNLWMYGTPVVYPISALSDNLKNIILLNPVTMPIEVFRYIFLGAGVVDIGYLGFSIGFTVMVFLIGIILFNRVERTFMDTV